MVDVPGISSAATAAVPVNHLLPQLSKSTNVTDMAMHML